MNFQKFFETRISIDALIDLFDRIDLVTQIGIWYIE